MPVPQVIEVKFTSGGEQIISRYEITVGAVHRISEIIPAAQTDLSIPLTVAIAKMETIFMKATDADINIDTNVSGSPVNVFPLKANGTPFVWAKDSGVLNPFTANVTGLFATTGTPGGTLDIIIGYDPT